MRKLLTLTLLVSFMGLWSCAYDDTHIWERVNDHENRISKLEQLCKEMNNNISAMQTILEAVQNNDCITSVTPIEVDGETIGYTITFAKSAPITIYHGKDGADGIDGVNGADGKDGHSPIVGVRQDSDGIYYWTLDGEWLLDDAGNKIKAVGVDGKDGQDGADGADGTDGKDGVDGITPQLKIENDYWYISYDNGATWTQLGKATGEDGKDGQDGANGNDGITPLLKIENDYWYISYDNGSTWTELGKAKGEDGKITYSDAEKKAALEKAEKIYNDWVKSGASEEDFKDLVEEHSGDTASVEDGGLYENVYPGQMVEKFEDFCYDENRKAGDHGIVETEFGYHIMYFVENEGLKYLSDIQAALESEKYNEYLTELNEAYPVDVNTKAVSMM